MKIQEMLKRKKDCADSFGESGEGADCQKCKLCDQVEVSSQTGEPGGFFLEGTEIKLIVNPCLLLDELAAKIENP